MYVFVHKNAQENGNLKYKKRVNKMTLSLSCLVTLEKKERKLEDECASRAHTSNKMDRGYRGVLSLCVPLIKAREAITHGLGP